MAWGVGSVVGAAQDKFNYEHVQWEKERNTHTQEKRGEERVGGWEKGGGKDRESRRIFSEFLEQKEVRLLAP